MFSGLLNKDENTKMSKKDCTCCRFDKSIRQKNLQKNLRERVNYHQQLEPRMDPPAHGAKPDKAIAELTVSMHCVGRLQRRDNALWWLEETKKRGQW